MVFVLPFQKPRLDGLALAFEIVGPAKAIVEPSHMAWLGPAYLGQLGLAHGPKPGQEQPLVAATPVTP